MVWGGVGGEALVVSVRLKEELKPRKGIQINRRGKKGNSIEYSLSLHGYVISTAIRLHTDLSSPKCSLDCFYQFIVF